MDKKRSKKYIIYRAISILLIVSIMIFNRNVFAAKGNPNNVTTTGENLIYNDPVYIEKHNANLSKLEISGYQLSPSFNKNTTTYYISIPKDVTSLDVVCEAEAPNAKYVVSGNTKLSTTKENRINVKVTAQAKNTKTYTIIVSRDSTKTLQLSELSVENATLSPEFSPNTYNYETEITTNKFEKLNISAITNSSTAQIEIVGNDPENFKYGDNIISIILKGSNEVTTYQIKVNFIEQTFTTITTETTSGALKWVVNVVNKVKEFLSYENNQLAVLIGIAALLFILVIVFAIKISKNKKKRRARTNDKKSSNTR